METDKYVFFWGHTPNALGVNIFNQWYPISFVERMDVNTPIIFANAEQYMMAHKAMLFGDSFNLKKIMETIDPKIIKALGRKINNFDTAIWDNNKFEIVAEGNRLKFNQNLILMERLLKTGNKKIVEAAPNDKVWGIGLKKEIAVNLSEDKWPGQNLLGKALMVVRSEYRV